MAGCDVVDAGYDVLFTIEQCFSTHRKAKEKIPMLRRGKEFQAHRTFFSRRTLHPGRIY